MSTGMITIIFIATVLGGALGAKLAHSQPWKGALIAAVALCASEGSASVFKIQNALISILITLAAAGIAGGLLKLQGRQIGIVIIGSILAAAATALIGGFIHGRS